MNKTSYWGSGAGLGFGPDLRIGDAERDAAVASLGEHFAAGRLTSEEYEERSTEALNARSGADLRRLFTDLPALGPSGHRPDAGISGWLPPWARSGLAGLPGLAAFLVVAGMVVVILALAVATMHVWPLLLLAWLWFCGPLRRWRSSRYRRTEWAPSSTGRRAQYE